jgi:hypothetical protein
MEYIHFYNYEGINNGIPVLIRVNANYKFIIQILKYISENK